MEFCNVVAFEVSGLLVKLYFAVFLLSRLQDFDFLFALFAISGPVRRVAVVGAGVR